MRKREWGGRHVCCLSRCLSETYSDMWTSFPHGCHNPRGSTGLVCTGYKQNQRWPGAKTKSATGYLKAPHNLKGIILCGLSTEPWSRKQRGAVRVTMRVSRVSVTLVDFWLKVFGEKKSSFYISIVKTPLPECQVISWKPFYSFLSLSSFLCKSYYCLHPPSSHLLLTLQAVIEMFLPWWQLFSHRMAWNSNPKYAWLPPEDDT